MNPTMWGLIGGIVIFVVTIVGWLIYIMVKKPNYNNNAGYNINIPSKKIKNKTGGVNMDKLEEEVFKEFKEAYNDIIDEIKRAEKDQDGIDLKDFVKSQAERFQNLNNHFREAKIRMGGK